MSEYNFEKELWTQEEVAGYFRTAPSTIYNWRKKGLLNYFQAPGSSRVLYFRDDVLSFMRQNSHSKKGGVTAPLAQAERAKPVVSTKNKKTWRI